GSGCCAWHVPVWGLPAPRPWRRPRRWRADGTRPEPQPYPDRGGAGPARLALSALVREATGQKPGYRVLETTAARKGVPMRIATRGICHETSTSAPPPTTLRDFETGFGLSRGNDLLDRFHGTNSCPGGFIDGAARHGFELAPLLA